jgi:hypothetical protein
LTLDTEDKDDLVEQLLIAVREGDTLRNACKEAGVPERTVRGWRQSDDELDEQFFRGRLDGTQAKLDMFEDMLKEAQKSGDRNRILAADKLLSHARWEAEKLLPLYQPVQKTEIAHSGPYVIGWDDGPSDVVVIEEARAQALPVNASDV